MDNTRKLYPRQLEAIENLRLALARCTQTGMAFWPTDILIAFEDDDSDLCAIFTVFEKQSVVTTVNELPG